MNSPLQIEVSDNGKVFAHMTTEKFMAFMDRPNRFLSNLVEDFNTMKKESGEPERVRVVLAKH